MRSLPQVAHWIDGEPLDDGCGLAKIEDRIRHYHRQGDRLPRVSSPSATPGPAPDPIAGGARPLGCSTAWPFETGSATSAWATLTSSPGLSPTTAKVQPWFTGFGPIPPSPGGDRRLHTRRTLRTRRSALGARTGAGGCRARRRRLPAGLSSGRAVDRVRGRGLAADHLGDRVLRSAPTGGSGRSPRQTATPARRAGKRQLTPTHRGTTRGVRGATLTRWRSPSPECGRIIRLC